MEELQTASRILEAALDRYLESCTAFSNLYDPGNTHNRPSLSLLSGITNELQLVGSYKLKVHQAEAIVGQIRNSTPALSPVDSLPSDILLHIFELVLHSQSCFAKRFDSSKIIHNYPEALSHVCSRWRQIALSARNLWTHVDLSLSPSRLLARSKAFATRARHSPLDLHVYDERMSKIQHSESDVVDFCAAVAPRMRSLKLLIADRCVRHSRTILWTCLANSVPGTLTELTMSTYISGDPFGLFENLQSQVLSPQLEEVLLRITRLNLNSVYPYWTSKAYHGLVELRLSRFSEGVTITESQLVHILTLSPGLRIFYFSLKITDQLLDGTPPPPISLQSLEVVNLSPRYYEHCEVLLRWLSPGSNPMHVSLKFNSINHSTKPFINEVYTSFYARSNISRLDLDGINCPLPLHRLLEWLPNLRVIKLKNLCFEEINEPLTFDNRLPQLDAMHIIDCPIPLRELRWLSKIHSIQTITVHGGQVLLRSGTSVTKIKGKDDILKRYLSGIAPVFKILSYADALDM